MEDRELKRTLAIETSQRVGQEVLLKGWVRTRRDHGKLIFFDLRDRSGIVQVVVRGAAEGLRPEDVVRVIGVIRKRPSGTINTALATGEVEVEASEISVLSKAATLPFDMGGETLNLELPTLLDYRTLALRHPKISAIFKVQETIAATFRNTLKQEGFTEIFVPTIVPVATEGGAEVFPVDYYGRTAYLAQSPQLYKQMMVSVFERVFTIAHAYRAEPSVTTRHLAEYVSLDAEFGFIDSWEELMDIAERVISSILRSIREMNQRVPEIKKTIPRLKLRDAQEILFKRTGKDQRNEPDFDPSGEKEICAWVEEETGAPFVFITHYPTNKRPFYTMPDPNDPQYSLSFDLLGISQEWVTGGQRINDYDRLLSRIKERGNRPEQFELYLQAFRYGMPPEGGFAIGLERLTKDILGLFNVREASLFPRDMERVDERFSQTEGKEAP